MRTTLIGIVAACLVAFTVLFQRPASALTPVAATPPAGLSVEAKDAPGNNGFDFKFKSGSSSATVSIDPLGNRHNDSATISSSGGAITLNGKYDRNNRKIEVTARRAGTEVGSYSWRVEAVLR